MNVENIYLLLANVKNDIKVIENMLASLTPNETPKIRENNLMEHQFDISDVQISNNYEEDSEPENTYEFDNTDELQEEILEALNVSTDSYDDVERLWERRRELNRNNNETQNKESQNNSSNEDKIPDIGNPLNRLKPHEQEQLMETLYKQAEKNLAILGDVEEEEIFKETDRLLQAWIDSQKK